MSALTPEELHQANAHRCAQPDPKIGVLVREPESNVYGKLKLLRRVDGLYVVYPRGDVYWNEKEARDAASAGA